MSSKKIIIIGSILLLFVAFLYAYGGEKDTLTTQNTAQYTITAMNNTTDSLQDDALKPSDSSSLVLRLQQIFPPDFAGSDFLCNYHIEYYQSDIVQQSFDGIVQSGTNFFIDSNQFYISIKLGTYMFTIDQSNKTAFYVDGAAALGAAFTKFGLNPISILHDSAYYIAKDELISGANGSLNKITIAPKNENDFLREINILYVSSEQKMQQISQLQMVFDNEKMSGDTGGKTIMTLKDFDFRKQVANNRFPYISIVGNNISLGGQFQDYKLSAL